ncbi:hypothetical protein [Candidatus Uabimicrobium amorphum]|uniref:Uncharacterized protein n=1 Tax=Uabimicrobium amorphum TaxID=2596890 RepID=A0A5S9IQA5_UABAM|nr:hypothetical protein [Candidatus Uabimicrobium amorphum]BBM86123.1 hypothetical protein UABAM_04509 [Candidatus Uabimicrobium amorphum]
MDKNKTLIEKREKAQKTKQEVKDMLKKLPREFHIIEKMTTSEIEDYLQNRKQKSEKI